MNFVNKIKHFEKDGGVRYEEIMDGANLNHISGSLVIFFEQDNRSNQLIFSEGTLTIIHDGLEIKPDMNPSDGAGKEKTEVVYQDFQIKTKGDTYFITNGDDLSLELQRIGERIVQDEDGKRYGTSQTLQ